MAVGFGVTLAPHEGPQSTQSHLRVDHLSGPQEGELSSRRMATDGPKLVPRLTVGFPSKFSGRAAGDVRCDGQLPYLHWYMTTFMAPSSSNKKIKRQDCDLTR